ncbi:2-acyl-glycerophospho-ethanolamine acyltransferase [compost metagenome]
MNSEVMLLGDEGMEESTQSKQSLFQNKIFARMYLAYATATFGDWFDALAIQVLVGYRWQASPFMLALIPVVMALPGVLLGSVAGVIADRLNKLRLMRMCDLFMMFLTLFILFAPNIGWLLLLLGLRAAISTVNIPAQQSMTRSIVREDQLLQATSLNGVVNQGSKIAGPLLGAVALTILTPQWCVFINGVMRGVSYLLLLTIKNSHKDTIGSASQTADQSDSILAMLTEGWKFIIRKQVLLNTMLFGITGALVIQMIDFQFTSLFRNIAPHNEALLGWMVAASGVGAICIIWAMNKWSSVMSGTWRLGLSYVLLGVSIAGLGLLAPNSSIFWILILGVILGIGNGMFFVTFNYNLQKETPSHMTGRVFGIQSTVMGVIMLTAPLIGGALVQFAGPALIFVQLGVVLSILGLVGLLFKRFLWRDRATPSMDHVSSS